MGSFTLDRGPGTAGIPAHAGPTGHPAIHPLAGLLEPARSGPRHAGASRGVPWPHVTVAVSALVVLAVAILLPGRGHTAARRAGGQQVVLLQASTAETVRPVPLARIPGAVIPEIAVNRQAAAGGQRIAVGSADGYPAIWRREADTWTLVSSGRPDGSP
jgi:hypothetical protein